MEVTILDRPFPETVFRQAHTRTEGLHLSDIIHDLEQTLWPNKYANTQNWNLNVAAQLGVLFERCLEMAYKDMFAPDIGEIEKDGVFMTPDGIDPELWRVVEYKLTWTSSRKPIEEKWTYMTQVKAYCYALGILEAELDVLYVVGDWRGSGPQREVYLLKFAPAELEENWIMLVNHAKYRGWL